MLSKEASKMHKTESHPNLEVFRAWRWAKVTPVTQFLKNISGNVGLSREPQPKLWS